MRKYYIKCKKKNRKQDEMDHAQCPFEQGDINCVFYFGLCDLDIADC